MGAERGGDERVGSGADGADSGAVIGCGVTRGGIMSVGGGGVVGGSAALSIRRAAGGATGSRVAEVAGSGGSAGFLAGSAFGSG
jgi:hypothetical protein